MAIIITCLLRILSLSPSEDIEQCAISTILEARKRTLDWCWHLKDCVNTGSDQNYSDQNEICLLRSALLCRTTYGVEERHLNRVLSGSEDASVFIQASILAQISTPSEACQLPGDVQRLLIGALKIAHALEARLQKLIIDSASSLSVAASMFLGDIRFDEPWELKGHISIKDR